MMDEFLKESNKLFYMMQNVRRKLHMYPEIDNKLYKTADIVESYLKEFNIDYKRYNNNGCLL
ncbi:MAG: amidohydrolase, partial [Caloramator sp.]|nr:amidohydrolase [Caloramator sp.]